jgi:hypothetical protein
MKEEINEVLFAIRSFTDEKIKSRDVGERVYKKNWKDIFSDRALHCKFNIILRLLDHLEIIAYRGGYIFVIKRAQKSL